MRSVSRSRKVLAALVGRAEMAEIYRPVLVPVIEPMDPRRCNVYEHTPLDYYRYGEYPRFIRPIGANRPQTKIVWQKDL